MLPTIPDFRRACSNTPADLVISKSLANLATDVTQDKHFRELLQLIAQLSKPASAGFVKRVDQGPKLGLTTAPLVSTVLENRDRKVKSLQDQAKLRDFGRITSIKSQHVKTQHYMAGNNVFPLNAPPSPPTSVADLASRRGDVVNTEWALSYQMFQMIQNRGARRR